MSTFFVFIKLSSIFISCASIHAQNGVKTYTDLNISKNESFIVFPFAALTKLSACTSF